MQRLAKSLSSEYGYSILKLMAFSILITFQKRLSVVLVSYSRNNGQALVLSVASA